MEKQVSRRALLFVAAIVFNVISIAAISTMFVQCSANASIEEYTDTCESPCPVQIAQSRRATNTDLATALFFAVQTVTTTGYGVGFTMINSLKMFGCVAMGVGGTIWALWTGIFVDWIIRLSRTKQEEDLSAMTSQSLGNIETIEK